MSTPQPQKRKKNSQEECVLDWRIFFNLLNINIQGEDMASGDEMCKGCYAFSNERLSCIVEPYYKGEYCPCLSCLLKMICRVDCDLFHKYANRQGLI